MNSSQSQKLTNPAVVESSLNEVSQANKNYSHHTSASTSQPITPGDTQSRATQQALGRDTDQTPTQNNFFGPKKDTLQSLEAEQHQSKTE